jgi:hypothetical protein
MFSKAPQVSPSGKVCRKDMCSSSCFAMSGWDSLFQPLEWYLVEDVAILFAEVHGRHHINVRGVEFGKKRSSLTFNSFALAQGLRTF